MPVVQTAEPSTSGLGKFIRTHADDFTGRALACLVAANRYEHIEHEIEPALHAGNTVICDRYLASTLVLQRIDGVPERFLLNVNAGILLPDLAVILTAGPAIITARLTERGARHRFHLDPATRTREVSLYDEAAGTLTSIGVSVLLLDTTHATPADVADRIADAIPPPAGSVDCHTSPNDPPVTP